jgi:hypothetical protein
MMTGLELAAIVVASVWLAGLTLLMTVVVRHLGLLTLRIQAGHIAEGDGLLIGDRVPTQALAVEPELDRVSRYLVFLSETCAACFALAPTLDRVPDPSMLVACVVGEGRSSARLAEAVSDAVPVIAGDAAKKLADAFRVRQTPQVLQVENGILIGRATPHDITDVVRLIDAYEYSDAGDVAIKMREEHEHAAV